MLVHVCVRVTFPAVLETKKVSMIDGADLEYTLTRFPIGFSRVF
jgi:hypothetical protein